MWASEDWRKTNLQSSTWFVSKNASISSSKSFYNFITLLNIWTACVCVCVNGFISPSLSPSLTSPAGPVSTAAHVARWAAPHPNWLPSSFALRDSRPGFWPPGKQRRKDAAPGYTKWTQSWGKFCTLVWWGNVLNYWTIESLLTC